MEQLKKQVQATERENASLSEELVSLVCILGLPVGWAGVDAVRTPHLVCMV